MNIEVQEASTTTALVMRKPELAGTWNIRMWGGLRLLEGTTHARPTTRQAALPF